MSDILDLSKIEAGRLEIEQRVFDLREELGGLIDLHQVSQGPGKGPLVPGEFGGAARGLFDGDSTRIKQVLEQSPLYRRPFTARRRGGLSAPPDPIDASRIGRSRRNVDVQRSATPASAST